MRTLYYSQITHELRTPLISVMTLLDKLDEYTEEGRGKYWKTLQSTYLI